MKVKNFSAWVVPVFVLLFFTGLVGLSCWLDYKVFMASHPGAPFWTWLAKVFRG